MNHPDGDAEVGRDEVIFAALYPGLRRFAAVVGPIEVEPEDLVQEALTRALAVGPLFDLRDPGAYLRTIVVRLAANHRRTLGRRRAAFHLLDQGSRTAFDVYPSDIADLGSLNPADRAVMYLSVVERATADEIGEVLGWSAGRVRMRKHRALRQLRTELEDRDG
jgi:DNA-directed RNA polymerase specialized sigma24 family protein